MTAFAILLGDFWAWTFPGFYQEFRLGSAYIYLLFRWILEENPLSEESFHQEPPFWMSPRLIQNNSIIPCQTRDMVKFHFKAILQECRKTFFSKYHLQQHHLNRSWAYSGEEYF